MFPESGDQIKFPFRGLKILLVEDDYVCRTLLEKVLKIEGMEVTAVSSGEAALDFFFKVQDIDLILMDIQLPGIDGIETTQKIKSFQADKNLNIPVIAITALASQWKNDCFFPEGFSEYLPKPVDMNLLFEVIRKQMEHYS